MNRSPKPLGFFACLFLLLFTASVAWGQTGTSSLRGVVVDNSGASIVGANIGQCRTGLATRDTLQQLGRI